MGVNTRQAIMANYAVAGILGIGISGGLADYPIKMALPGLFLGVFFYLIFLTMAKTSQVNGVSVAAVANKMSVVIPILAALVLHDETFGPANWIGVFLALPAIVLVSMRGKTEMKNLLAPLVLFVGSGTIDTALDWIQHNHLETKNFGLFSSTIFFGAFATALAHHLLSGKGKVPLNDLKWGTVLGLVNFGAIFFILQALALPNWPSSVIFPINHTSTVVLSALIGWGLMKERLSVLNVTGIFLALCSIFLMF